MASFKSCRSSAPGHHVHLGIAESGKTYALEGNHREALRHYREAIRVARQVKAPEVFFRHYTQCVLESLELSGSHSEVIGFCERADSFHASIDTGLAMHARDHGSILERLGINRLRAGDRDGATEALSAALERTGGSGLPLAAAVLRMLQRGMTPDARRLLELQRRHHYFVVRQGYVDDARVRRLPGGGAETTAR